jgi:beta-mannosidase
VASYSSFLWSAWRSSGSPASWADTGEVSVTIAAQGHAYLVHILSPVPGVRFSDNYFDLRDGETTTITVVGLPDGFPVQELEVRGYAGARIRV